MDPQNPIVRATALLHANEMDTRALQCFERALEVRPDYTAARHVVEAVRRKLN